MLRSELEKLLSLLDPREREILRLRYGLDGGPAHSRGGRSSPPLDSRADPADRAGRPFQAAAPFGQERQPGPARQLTSRPDDAVSC